MKSDTIMLLIQLLLLGLVKLMIYFNCGIWVLFPLIFSIAFGIEVIKKQLGNSGENNE